MFKKSVLLTLLVVCVSTIHAQTVAYVTNQNDNTVSVINTSTNTVTATIPVGNTPEGVAVSPDGTRAYVTNIGDSTVSVINTASNSVVATVSLTSNSFPLFPAVTPDGTKLYVPEGFANVQVISTATNSVIATIPVGGAWAVAITPDGAHAYVLNGNVVVVDTASNTVVQTIGASADDGNGFSRAIAITPNGRDVYVSDGGRTSAEVIDTTTNTNFATIALPQQAPFRPTFLGLAITPDGSRVYVANGDDGVVEIIDTATNTVEATQIPAGFPVDMAVTPDGSFLYVVNAAGNNVFVIAIPSNTLAATVPVGSNPSDIAIANLSVPFAAFTIDNLVINSNLHEQGDFTLAANTGGIDLAHQPLTLTVNNFSITIPAGSFQQVGGTMHFVFNGTVNGLNVNFDLQAENGSSTQFDYVVDVHGVNISGPDPASVGLKIGHNSGTTTAEF